MTTADPTPMPASPHAAQPHEEPHGEDDVHVYETSGITEGNKKVPLWLTVSLLALLVFWVAYIVVNWHAQPSTAQFK